MATALWKSTAGSAPITVEADIPATVSTPSPLRYANGNGPVNTENKAAIRTLCVDGDRKGVLVMPQRGGKLG